MDKSDNSFQLSDGAQVAVIGGGPAGAFFAYFMLDMAVRAGRQISVDIYEPRNFLQPGPVGCNMCAGIVSESLVQMLATEGINLPSTVVQRGIDSYVLHMDVGSARIDTPLQEKRIGAVYRGAGPRDLKEASWRGLDGHLLSLALDKGARIVNERVSEVAWEDGRPQIRTRKGTPTTYDLLVVTAGVNTPLLKQFEGTGYEPPQTTKTYLREYFLGEETVQQYLGDAIQVFLLDIPRLEFGMLIPKRTYVTVCLLGEDIDNDLVQKFLDAPEVKACLPVELDSACFSCQCGPRINTRAAQHPFADRLVFIGDCSATRLFKDGIGSAYRTAKTAAATAVFQGVSAEDFARHYQPALDTIEEDNDIGRFIFRVVTVIQKQRFARRAMLRMIQREQGQPGHLRRMSTVQWDMYTGSGSYKEILMRTIRPAFILRLTWEAILSLLPFGQKSGRPGAASETEKMLAEGALGKLYQPGDILVRQGEVIDHMLVIQEGQVALLRQEKGEEVFLGVRSAGEIVGETAVFEKEVQPATVQALSPARVLTVDKENFLKRVHHDPSLAFNLFRLMSRRQHELSQEVTILNQEIDRLSTR